MARTCQNGGSSPAICPFAGFAVLLAALGPACSDKVPSGIHDVSIPSTTRAHWETAGFVEMVPPLRPPSTVDGSDLIEVWLKLPPHGQIQTFRLADQDRFTIALPPGTEADRVELFAPSNGSEARVADVRGTTFGEGATELFHVYRATGGTLAGFEWQRGNTAQQRDADEGLRRLLRRSGERDGAIDRLVALNDCSSCHQHNKPETKDVTDTRVPRRAADQKGLYHILSVLETSAPVELSRPRDMNADDPFVHFSCKNGEARVVPGSASGARAVRCTDASIPRGELDVRAALAAGDAHAEKVCASRRYLFGRLDAEGLLAFAAGFDACGITAKK